MSAFERTLKQHLVSYRVARTAGVSVSRRRCRGTAGGRSAEFTRITSRRQSPHHHHRHHHCRLERRTGRQLRQQTARRRPTRDVVNTAASDVTFSRDLVLARAGRGSAGAPRHAARRAAARDRATLGRRRRDVINMAAGHAQRGGAVCGGERRAAG